MLQRAEPLYIIAFFFFLDGLHEPAVEYERGDQR